MIDWVGRIHSLSRDPLHRSCSSPPYGEGNNRARECFPSLFTPSIVILSTEVVLLHISQYGEGNSRESECFASLFTPSIVILSTEVVLLHMERKIIERENAFHLYSLPLS